MANAYIIGNIIKVSAAFTVSGTATDPTTVTCRVKDPIGNTTVYTFAGGTVTKDSTGNYHVNVTMDIAGNYYIRWEGTGTAAADAEETVMITPSNVI